jgi:CARDB protein
MRRTALTIAFFALLAAPAHATAPAKVTLTACVPRERAAEFEARMGKVEHASKLKMRFTLQARKPGKKAFHRVSAPGFSSWTTADPGTSRYVFTRRVEGLIGPARYRAMVRFKWIDAHGKAILTARRFSKACRQPDHRPNLRIKALSHEGKHRYVALVVNNGRTAVGAFDLQVAVGASVLDPVVVAGLDPGEQTLVTVRGPRCSAGTKMTATADPLDLVDERNEHDNVFSSTCA